MRSVRETVRRLTRCLMAVLAAVGLAGALIISVQQPAYADSVWASGGSVIINVKTGAKNTANRTQWVESIYLTAGTAESNSYGCGKFESWTQNLYGQAERCGDAYWTINRWVGTGHYVCGAFDDFGGWPRQVACIAIRV